LYASGGFASDAAVHEPGRASPASSREPLRDVDYRYESPSRVTATVRDRQGGRVTVLVLTRSGIRWRLSDIRLP
jgi:hypothetical protein